MNFHEQNATFNATFVVCLVALLFSPSISGTDNEYLDDGGWYTNPADRIVDAGPCNIEVRNASITQQEFLERYAFKQPLIVKGLTDNSAIRAYSRKDYLLSHYGNKVIRLSSANTFSYRKVDVTLEKYINEILGPQRLDTLGNETLYWFGDNDHKEWEELFSSYKKPTLYLPRLTEAYSYGVAGPGTGVPFHFHGPGFAEVIYGRKRWFLFPPHAEPKFNPDKTTLHWLLEEYPHLTEISLLLECTIGPGDIIYFPDHWWHGTLNIDTSVFISTFLG